MLELAFRRKESLELVLFPPKFTFLISVKCLHYRTFRYLKRMISKSLFIYYRLVICLVFYL